MTFIWESLWAPAACDHWHWQSGLWGHQGEIFLMSSVFFVCGEAERLLLAIFALFCQISWPWLSKYLPLTLGLNSMPLTVPCDSDIKPILDLTNVWSNCWVILLQQWILWGFIFHPNSLWSKQAHCRCVSCLMPLKRRTNHDLIYFA